MFFVSNFKTIMINLATIGENLKVFSYFNSQLTEKDSALIDDYKDSSEHVTWAGNGLWLCGGPVKTGVVPIYKYENEKLVRKRSFEDSNATVCTFLNYTNQDIIIGNKTGAVNAWDIKGKKIVHSFCGENVESVTHLAVNADDGALAVGTEKKIKVFGLKTKIQTGTCEYTGQLSSLQFSPLRKNYLGGCTLESSIYIWDTYKGVPIVNMKNVHEGACTGIAMSPVNMQLLTSVARDKSLKFHDIRKKEPVHRFELHKHLTAVDMLLPHALALGTLDGYLLIFDLRNSQVLSEVSAHSTPIKSVKRAPDLTNSRFIETVINSPDELPKVIEPDEISITDLLLDSFQASKANEPSPIMPYLSQKKRTSLASQLRKSTSPFDFMKMEMKRKASTPCVDSNCTDSFFGMFQSPEPSHPIDDRPVLPSPPVVEIDVPMNGNHEEELTLPPLSEAPVCQILNQLVQSIATLTEDNRILREDNVRLQEQFQSCLQKIEDNRDLIFDLRRLVLSIPDHMRWEGALVEMGMNGIIKEIENLKR